MYMMKKIKNYFMPGHQQTYQPLSLYQQTHKKNRKILNPYRDSSFAEHFYPELHSGLFIFNHFVVFSANPK